MIKSDYRTKKRESGESYICLADIVLNSSIYACNLTYNEKRGLRTYDVTRGDIPLAL